VVGKKKPESTFVEPLDFPYIMFKQISLILEARHEANKEKYVDDVNGLEDLLTSFWMNDGDYKKDAEKIENEDYGTWRTEEERWGIEAKKARKKFRRLMMLISESGMMPEKKFTEVWE